MKKFLSHEIFYTHAVTDVTDNYQVWTRGAIFAPHPLKMEVMGGRFKN